MPSKPKRKAVKGYMTFRNGVPLQESLICDESYRIYDDKAPIYQYGDKSVACTITFHPIQGLRDKKK